MRYYAGLDVSMAETSICVVNEEGTILREGKAAREPEAIATSFAGLCVPSTRVGLETDVLAGGLAGE